MACELIWRGFSQLLLVILSLVLWCAGQDMCNHLVAVSMDILLQNHHQGKIQNGEMSFARHVLTRIELYVTYDQLPLSSKFLLSSWFSYIYQNSKLPSAENGGNGKERKINPMPSYRLCSFWLIGYWELRGTSLDYLFPRKMELRFGFNVRVWDSVDIVYSLRPCLIQ